MKLTPAKKFLAATLIGAFAFSIPVATDAAKRIHDPKVATKKVERKTLPTLRERVAETMGKFKSDGSENFEVFDRERNAPVDLDRWRDDSAGNFDASNVSVPKTVSTYDSSILGTPIATQEQCVRYLLRNNPYPNLPVSAEEIVAYYYEEAAREGIRPDVAFCQALKETGFFRYGGDVIPEQNNYCGLGTTGGGVKGEFFSSPRMGVRAHIQHLLAYTSTRRPTTPVVDPRYSLVRQSYGTRTLGTWQDLNGRWAVPGRHYGQDILSMFRAILVQ